MREKGKHYILYTDGGSWQDKASIGIVLWSGGKIVYQEGQAIGPATNNEAEYRALIRGLELVIGLGIKQLRVRMDSQLVVRQVQGRYRVHAENLKGLHQQVCELRKHFTQFSIWHVPRNSNKQADALASRALKGQNTKTEDPAEAGP